MAIASLEKNTPRGTRVPCEAPSTLPLTLDPQRRRRIHARRPPAWNEAREHADATEKQRSADENRGAVRLDAEQQRRDESAERQRSDRAEQNSQDKRARAVCENEPDDVWRPSAHRNANAHLVQTLPNPVSDDRIDSHGCDDER